MRLRADGYADMRGLVTTVFVFTGGLDSFSLIERLPCKTDLTLNVHQVLALRLFVFLVSILLSGLLFLCSGSWSVMRVKSGLVL